MNFKSLSAPMSQSRPTGSPSTPKRSFGVDGSALDTDGDTPGSLGDQPRRVLGRVSFDHSQPKPSFIARWRKLQDEEDGRGSTVVEPPLIPSALEQKGEAYSTPLPALSMIVLSIVSSSTMLYTSID